MAFNHLEHGAFGKVVVRFRVKLEADSQFRLAVACGDWRRLRSCVAEYRATARNRRVWRDTLNEDEHYEIVISI